MKNTLVIILLLFSASSFAQNNTFYSPAKDTSASYIYYAAAKTGISMREKPNAAAAVLEKIPYGAQVTTLADTMPPVSIITEGFNGWWWKVRYNNKIGYVVSSYLLPLAPPKAGIKSIKEYFAQLSSPSGNPVVLKKGNAETIGEGGSLKKQLYENGMEWHETEGYEEGATIYIIPDLSVEQAFLLLRIVNEFPDLVGEKDPLPSKSSTTKKGGGERKVMVEKEMWYGNAGVVKRLIITSTEGALSELQLFLLYDQVVIIWSSGV
jgi:hypothetical protein